MKKNGRPLIWFVGLLLTALLGVVASVRAQGGEPPREARRDAPAREPVVRRTQALPGGDTIIVVQLPAEADAYIASERPDQNFGAAALYLGYNLSGNEAFGAERVLLYFDVLGEIPAGAFINEARLRLYLNFASPGDDEPMGTVLRRVASSWDEAAVTWNAEPTWGEIRTSAGVSSTLTWYAWDVTDLVADWVDGTHPNYGLEIIGDERIQQRERSFYSRETNEDFFPHLVVDYTVFDDDLPPVVSVDPLPVYSSHSFTVTWSGADQGSAGIDYYDVQYRVDDGDWVDWLLKVTRTSGRFQEGENGRYYEFRARGVDRADNVEPFGDPEAHTTVDAGPPTSRVAPLPIITSQKRITVSWTGSDGGGAGIQYYDVQYRFNNGDWLPWQQQTIATQALFVAGEDGVYAFEARAVDHLGQSEPFVDRPEAFIAVDAEPPFIEPRLWLPLAMRQW